MRTACTGNGVDLRYEQRDAATLPVWTGSRMPSIRSADESGAKRALLSRIDSRRRAIEQYLSETQVRRGRLVMSSIVGSTLSAAFAAAPAIGGQSLTETMRLGLGLDQGSGIWRTLCAIALVASVCAAISANLLRSGDYAARISVAEACNMEFASLRNQLEFAGTTVLDGIRSFNAISSRTPYIISSESVVERRSAQIWQR